MATNAPPQASGEVTARLLQTSVRNTGYLLHPISYKNYSAPFLHVCSAKNGIQEVLFVFLTNDTAVTFVKGGHFINKKLRAHHHVHVALFRLHVRAKT